MVPGIVRVYLRRKESLNFPLCAFCGVNLTLPEENADTIQFVLQFTFERTLTWRVSFDITQIRVKFTILD